MTTIDDAQAALEAVRRERGIQPPRPRPALIPRQPATLEGVLARFADVGAWASDDEVARYEAGRERERRLERMRDSGIAEVLTEDMLAAVASSTCAQTEALDLVRRWVAYQRVEVRARGPKPVLVLLGSMGRGKTVAAAHLLAAEGGRYVQAEELCRLHAARFGPEREECARILRCGVIVVDELGTEEDTARATATLHDVVDRRQGRKLTLLLGNLDRAALRKRYDARTVDRLRSCATIVEVAGASMRTGDL